MSEVAEKVAKNVFMERVETQGLEGRAAWLARTLTQSAGSWTSVSPRGGPA